MAIPSQAIKPVIPEVFSSHRYTVWSVSYTHLDVYKRQTADRVNTFLFMESPVLLCRVIIVRKCRRELVH